MPARWLLPERGLSRGTDRRGKMRAAGRRQRQAPPLPLWPPSLVAARRRVAANAVGGGGAGGGEIEAGKKPPEMDKEAARESRRKGPILLNSDIHGGIKWPRPR